jgi:hypothetical protein
MSKLTSSTIKNPTKVAFLRPANVSHRTSKTTAVRNALPTRQFTSHSARLAKPYATSRTFLIGLSTGQISS